ncbi:hypothetical protein ACFE04_009356 [Oxalis oulophora]
MGKKNTQRGLSLFLALVFGVSIVPAIFNQNVDVRERLKRLNKSYVKSILSSDGDIIDCVKLTDQPAFDHPMLKNHTIQLSPTLKPELGRINTQTNGERSRHGFSQLWHLSGTEGTIPIKRTKKRDILREIAFTKKILSTNAIPRAQKGNEEAIGYINGGRYFGAGADLNVWTPFVYGKSEYSKTQIQVMGAYSETVDSIEVGWHNDKYVSGCYNFRCPGFVQVSSKLLAGGTIWPVSTYNGEQLGINLLIWKDKGTGNWWLTSGDENIGYWPSSLFSFLTTEGAVIVQWGGAIQNDGHNFRHTSTDMGSGYYPYEGFGKASIIKNIVIFDENTVASQPHPVIPKANRPGCYDVKVFDSTPGDRNGIYLYYGGPGRNQTCL